MSDASALQARVEQEMQRLHKFWRRDRFNREMGIYGVPVEDVEALVIRLLTEQQRVEAQMQELQARVEPLKAGADGQDLPQSGNELSPSLPSGRNEP